MTRPRLVVAPLVLLLFACGGSGSGGGGADAGAGGGADGGGGCTSAAQCAGDEVCNPSTGECEAGVPCEAHGDCGTGGHCVSGTCEPNETGGTCDGDVNCPAGDTCIDGFCGCEGVAFAAMPIVPDVMVVLDKSGSMEEDLDGDCPLLDGDGQCDYPPHGSGDSANPAFDGLPDKWGVATDAVSGILDSHGSKVRFGLVTFSSDGSCGAGNVRVDIANNNEADIRTIIDGTNPRGSTPIGDTLADLVGHPALQSTAHPNYVLLVTDGQETCDGNPVAAARNLYQQTPRVKTFVVGFGGGVDAGELNDIATEGGTARPGPTKYYQADNAAELADALDSILGSVLSCEYQLDQVPEDLDQLYVYADGDPIGRDPGQTEGWDYDGATGTLTFYGQICQDLKDGSVTDLTIVYGCPGTGVE